jgi:hypothetical protein
MKMGNAHARTRRCFGYKLLILSDLATTLPLIEVRPSARLRWVCPNSKPSRRSGSGICKGVETKPHDDPRLYTFLPRGGSHRHAALRTALLLRRNGVESINASLKNLASEAKTNSGLAGPATLRWTGCSRRR